MKAAFLLAVALLTACSNAPTVIDGSSRESFEKSVEKARRDLPIKDRLTFDAALHNPAGRRFGSKNMDELARESFNGMTAFDVVADARARGIE